MKKWMKGTAFLSLLFVLFSLVGCGSNEQTTNETKKEEKTVQIKKQNEQEKKEEAKVEPSSEQNKPTDSSTVASEEKKENQSTTPTSTSKQTSPSNQQQTPTTKNTAVTTNKSSTPTTTPHTPTSTTPASKPSTTATPKPTTTVTLSIVGPKDRGNIVAATKVSFNEGDTIYDIILATAKKHGIVIDSRGSGATAYIEGIDNIYEFDYGPKSGWVFEQNGISLTKSIGVTKIKDGDRIECIYTE
jgi:cytoskeletal protein RodZ